MSRESEVAELRRELGDLGRDLRASMEGIRSDLTTGYVSTSGMGAVTAAWSTTIQHVEDKIMAQLALVDRDVKVLDERLDTINGWFTWAGRIVGAVILLGLLALLGLGTGNL